MRRAVMIRRVCVLVIALACLGSWSARAGEPAQAAGEIMAAARLESLDKLLSERGTARDFDRAVREAREAGVSPQAILEARFLYHVDKEDDAALVAMLPELVNHQAAFKLEDSAIFSVPEDWLAIIEYVRSLAALDAGDRAAFKRHITEAFWLSPRQALAFAPHIEKLRIKESMADVKLDLAVPLTPVIEGGEVTLAGFMKDRKAILLHFWSPWCRQCEIAMPGFLATASSLPRHAIAVASMIPEQHPQLIDEARATVRSMDQDVSGSWLVDPKGGAYARQLRVQDLPTVVLVSADGAVLFNGSLHDDALWKALADIDAGITRPEPLRRGAP